MMRSLFSFPLCSSLQTTQTAVLQLRHRRDQASLLPCPPASPSGRVLILSAPRARPRSRLLEIGVADSLTKRVANLNPAGVSGTACIGRAKQEKFWEVRQATHTQDGQDRELCLILHLIPEVLVTSQPHPSPRSKRIRETKGRKSVFFRG